jgi:hypothetical protein
MSYPARSAKATTSADMLRSSATQENQRTRRPERRSMRGAMTSTPPRMSSITKTMLTPSNV